MTTPPKEYAEVAVNMVGSSAGILKNLNNVCTSISGNYL